MPDTAIIEQEKVTIKINREYNVIFHNDDRTPMDFVIAILEKIFNKSRSTAVALMLEIHNNGSAVVATYSCHDMAEQKVFEVISISRNAGYPLQVSID